MTDDLQGDTYLNYCFILRGKLSDFWKAKKYILELEDSSLLFDKCSFCTLICKEKIPQLDEGLDRK